ncbi:hypothetical protein GCM10009634_16040 [Saccharothrix xinjiangensis]
MPPGMPKTTSQPTASRERTSDWAPVTRTGAPLGGAGFGRGPGRGDDSPGAGREVALVIFCLVVKGARSGHEKTLANPDGWDEGRASTQTRTA